MPTVEQVDAATRTVIENALTRLADLGLRADWTSHGDSHGRATSGILTMTVGDAEHELPAIAATAVTLADLTLLTHDSQTILVTDHVPPARADALRDRGWGGFVDSSGNVSLRDDALIIEISGRRGPVAPRPVVTAAPLTRAGLPVTFALLVANRAGITPSQRALASWSGASIGTVNRVIRALRERVPAMVDKGTNALLRPTALEDEWISAYTAMQPGVWPEERFDSDVWALPSDVLDAELPAGALLGSEAAAARLGVPIRPSSVVIHIDHDSRTRSEIIRQGRLRRAEDGMIRIRTGPWRTLPTTPEKGTAPQLLLRADLLLEDDPRADEARSLLMSAGR